MDHIYPCAKADLTTARGKRCLGSENLVPRLASEKASKGKRLNWRPTVRVIVPVPSAVEEGGAEAMQGVCGWGQSGGGRRGCQGRDKGARRVLRPCRSVHRCV